MINKLRYELTPGNIWVLLLAMAILLSGYGRQRQKQKLSAKNRYAPINEQTSWIKKDYTSGVH